MATDEITALRIELDAALADLAHAENKADLNATLKELLAVLRDRKPAPPGPAPVINVSPTPVNVMPAAPRGFAMTFDYDRQDRITAARITPVPATKP